MINDIYWLVLLNWDNHNTIVLIFGQGDLKAVRLDFVSIFKLFSVE